jgi:5-oxoprolinase (ATP-hydrolysing)
LGGKPALRGKNFLYKKDGRVINMGAKNSTEIVKGDKLRIMTPGGGGYGKPEDEK